MMFELLQSIEESGRYRGSAKRSVFRAAAFMPGLFVHPVPAPAAMKLSAPGFGRAWFPVIGPTGRARSGTTSWPKAFPVVCIGSSG